MRGFKVLRTAGSVFFLVGASANSQKSYCRWVTDREIKFDNTELED